MKNRILIWLFCRMRHHSPGFHRLLVDATEVWLFAEDNESRDMQELQSPEHFRALYLLRGSLEDANRMSKLILQRAKQ
jgi:hypothetical protein